MNYWELKHYRPTVYAMVAEHGTTGRTHVNNSETGSTHVKNVAWQCGVHMRRAALHGHIAGSSQSPGPEQKHPAANVAKPSLRIKYAVRMHRLRMLDTCATDFESCCADMQHAKPQKAPPKCKYQKSTVQCPPFANCSVCCSLRQLQPLCRHPSGAANTT